MKKTLLLSTALLVGVAGYSQDLAKKAVGPKLPKKTSVAARKKSASEHQFANANAKKAVYPKTSTACSQAAPFTQAPNAFATGGAMDSYKQGVLTYNKDLNRVFWDSRASTEWAWTGRTSGAMQSTFLNLKTNKWDSTIAFADPSGTYPGRYPAGMPLNTPGDTALADAFVTASGPVTVGGSWVGNYYAARSLAGGETAIHTPPAADYSYAAVGSFFGNIDAGFLNVDMQQLNGAGQVIVTGSLYDPQITATNANAVTGAIIAKATLAGGVVTWTHDSLKPSFYNGTLNYANDAAGARIAFGPDGKTGYAVFLGRLAQNFNNSADSAFTPIVYKSTDGGTTWGSPILPGYDWACHHPECLQGVTDLAAAFPKSYYDINTRNFSFQAYNDGADLTVDANGTLHFVTTLIPPNIYPDSLDFTFPYYYDNVTHHPIIWDFMCDGTDWKTMAVDSVMSCYCGDATTDSTNQFSPFSSDGSTTSFLGYGAHIQVSRSTDGKVVFYGWSDSDRGNVTSYNNQPDVLMKAYDVTTGNVSATTDVTGANGTAFYPFLSDVSYYDNAQSAWVVPVVYGRAATAAIASTPQNIYDGTAAMQFYYNNCGVFNAANVNTPAQVYVANSSSATVCGSSIAPTGIASHNAFESSISNYPNPFSNTTTIAVNLSENKAVDVKIYNTIGTLVFSKNVKGNVGQNEVTFDGGQLSSGVYYYTVTAGNEQATKKMIIQK